MVAAGGSAHTDHGMTMLDVFRDVVNGNIKDYTIKDPLKLEEVAKSIGIEVEGREIKEIAIDLYEELGFGKWGFAVDPHEMAQMMIDHIDKKRKALVKSPLPPFSKGGWESVQEPQKALPLDKPCHIVIARE